MGNLNAIATIIERELIRYWRDKGRMFTTTFQPLMFLFVFGSGLRQSLSAGSFGVDYTTFMYPGIVAISIMSVSFFSTISTVWDREFGFLKEILVAPVSRTAIAIGKTGGAAVIAMTQGLVLLLLAPFLGIHLHAATIPVILLLMCILSFAIAGIGLLIASLVRTIENFSVIMNLLVFPMFFLSGAFFPLTAVPLWMKIISAVNPLSYGVDALRQILLASQVGGGLSKLVLHSPIFDAGFLICFSVVFLSTAVVAFNKRD